MNQKSSADIERHAEDVREQMAYTADRLRERLTPGQLVDEAAHYLRHSDGAVSLHNLQTQVRDNPMALALVGAGLAWLMFGSGPAHASRNNGSGNGFRHGGNGHTRWDQPSAHADYSSEFGPDRRFEDAEGSWASDAADMADRMGDDATSYAESVRSGASEAYRDASSTAGDAYRTARDSAAHLRGRMGERSRALSGSVSDTVGHLGASGRGAAHGARRTFDDLLDREPLIVGAIGLAVGAAIGALMPRTHLEDEYLGDASDSMKRDASEMMNEGLEEAKDVAGKGYAAAKQAMQEENLVPGDTSVAKKVEHVADAAFGAVEDEAKNKAPDVRKP